MIDIAETLHAWHTGGKAFALATVVSTRGSAPRGPGAALAVDAGGTAVGSVSSGCVEGAVYEQCVESLRTGEPVLMSFSADDDDPLAPALTCGGEIEVFVQPVPAGDPVIGAALSALAAGKPVTLARIVKGPAELLGQAPGEAAAGIAEVMADFGVTGTFRCGSEGPRCGEQLTVFVEAHAAPPRMIVFGAGDFTAALVSCGKLLGYHVTVCDARPVFATARRFPDADEIVVDWPHRYLARTPVDGRTVLAVLTHDAKFDIPLLTRALRMPVAYVGAMGSRRTCAELVERLRGQGLAHRELRRLHAPIGLDLDARRPGEVAVAIAAEIIAARGRGTGLPLREVSTPIHSASRPREESEARSR